MTIRIVDVREDLVVSVGVPHGHFVDVEVTTGTWWWRKTVTRTLYREDYNMWFDLAKGSPIKDWVFWEHNVWQQHRAEEALRVLQQRISELRERDTAGKNTVSTGPHR
jgi:hypothetical protein